MSLPTSEANLKRFWTQEGRHTAYGVLEDLREALEDRTALEAGDEGVEPYDGIFPALGLAFSIKDQFVGVLIAGMRWKGKNLWFNLFFDNPTAHFLKSTKTVTWAHRRDAEWELVQFGDEQLDHTVDQIINALVKGGILSVKSWQPPRRS